MEITGINTISEDTVVELLKKAEKIGVDVWIAGGWGVDALVGYQTRPHNDLDFFIQKKDKIAFTELLKSVGFEENLDYNMEDNPIWCNTLNGIVDLHLFEIVETGTWRIQKQTFPSNIFSGKGSIGGITVCCLTVEAQVEYRRGYELREKDVLDVLLLCKIFALPVPEHFYKAVILSRICYTELVYGRINKKLKSAFSKPEIEEMLYNAIDETQDDFFQRIGKNIYVTNNEKNIKITINSNTYRVITVDSVYKIKPS
jgi:lincosamide nucleotidyltransferase A/C/D/E